MTTVMEVEAMMVMALVAKVVAKRAREVARAASLVSSTCRATARVGPPVHFLMTCPQGQGGPTGGTGSQPGPGGKWFGGEDEDPELAEIQDAIAMQQLDDEKMRAEMAEMDEPPPNDNASEGSDPPLPPPATEKEIAEAQEIVKRAQDDLIERNKMKAKVKDANKTDLQAMINARLAKR